MRLLPWLRAYKCARCGQFQLAPKDAVLRAMSGEQNPGRRP